MSSYSPGTDSIYDDRTLVPTLHDSFGFAAKFRLDSTKKPVQKWASGCKFPHFRHVYTARIVQAVKQWSDLVGLENRLDQQPRDLVYTKHNHTKHQMRLDFFVSTHS